MKLFNFIVVTVFVGLLAASCNTNLDDSVAPSLTQEEKLVSYIRNLGYKGNDIVKTDKGLLVDGDIIFPNDMEIPASSANGRPGQYYNNSLISFAKQNDIKVFIDNSISSGYNLSYDVREALRVWNLQNTRINFREVTSGSYDILVTDSNLGNGVCGSAFLSSNGNPGNIVYLNKGLISNNSYEQRKRTIIHELGHTMGFVHTNWNTGGGGSSGIDVPGVGGNDAGSLMNGGQCNSGAVMPNNNDKAAVVSLYPTDMPHTLYYSNQYPISVTWQTPPYTGAGSIVNYDFYYTAYTYQAGQITSQVITTTSNTYTFSFTQGQYSGASLVSYVRARYSNGYVSNWNSYNTTLN